MFENQTVMLGAAVLAAATVGLVAYRQKVKASKTAFGRLKAGKPVGIESFVVEYRSKPKAMTLEGDSISRIEEQGKIVLDSAAQLKLKECLLRHRETVANLEAAEKLRCTAFNEMVHVPLLKELWRIAFGDDCEFERTSERWSRLGFQGLDPQTDLRGGGVLALEQFLFFAKSHPGVLREMIRFNDDQITSKTNSWFLTAVVSIQFTVQLKTCEHQTFAPHLRILYGNSEGLNMLHCELMRHFFECWRRDKPHVMEYTIYIPKVYGTFFKPDYVPIDQK